MLTQKLMELTIVGGSEWVMVLLLILSVISFSVIVERAWFFRRHRRELDTLDGMLVPLIEKHDRAAIETLVGREDSLLFAVTAPSAVVRDAAASEKLIAGALDRERLRLERRLAFLGTLGNNAPFIGLFGTVLGIIRAFHDLSLEQMKGASAVMAGISEALVATAIGLFVAIPAVIAFNYFQRQVDHALSITQALAQTIFAVTLGNSPEPARAERD